MNEYYTLLPGEDLYASSMRLVQIFHSLNYLHESQKRFWLSRLIQQEFTELSIEIIQSRLKEDIQYISHVLSIGEKWETEEILLILQQRIMIDLFIEFFLNLHGRLIKLEMKDIDYLIKSTSKTKLNRNSFESAISLIKKNWGIPLNSRWLDLSQY